MRAFLRRHADVAVTIAYISSRVPIGRREPISCFDSFFLKFSTWTEHDGRRGILKMRTELTMPSSIATAHTEAQVKGYEIAVGGTAGTDYAFAL